MLNEEALSVTRFMLNDRLLLGRVNEVPRVYPVAACREVTGDWTINPSLDLLLDDSVICELYRERLYGVEGRENR
jgi:hypothetical protein